MPDKRLSLARAFPFMRHPLAVELAKQTTIQNGAIGLVFFVPGADMPLIALNQAKMVLQIAAVYGKEMNRDRIGEILAVMAGGFGCRAVARQLVARVPVLGWAIKPAVAASGTMAMAIAAIEYYEEPRQAARSVRSRGQGRGEGGSHRRQGCRSGRHRRE